MPLSLMFKTCFLCFQGSCFSLIKTQVRFGLANKKNPEAIYWSKIKLVFSSFDSDWMLIYTKHHLKPPHVLLVWNKNNPKMSVILGIGICFAIGIFRIQNRSFSRSLVPLFAFFARLFFPFPFRLVNFPQLTAQLTG